MPVMFKCKTCGTEHQSNKGWNSMESFDAVPSESDMGSWQCPDNPKAAVESYTKGDLRWHSAFEMLTWDELQKLLKSANEALHMNGFGTAAHLNEIEMEIETRKFQVAACGQGKEVVLAGCRTMDQCEVYMSNAGLKKGDHFDSDGAICNVEIKPLNQPRGTIV